MTTATAPATISVQSSLYRLPGVVSASEWNDAGPEDWITVTTPGGLTDEYLKRTWEIDPT